MGRFDSLLWQAVLLGTLSMLPGVKADCFIDDDGFERCSLSTGARIGIAIAIVLLALVAICSAMAYRQKRMRRGGVTYIGPPNPQNVNYGGQPGYYPDPAYSPGPGYYNGAPQYPPPVHGYNPQAGFAPPQGPPPGYYPPPQGSPPVNSGKDTM